MKLIDADKLRRIFEDSEYPCKLQETLLGIVDEQPTAYDVDEVVEQLEMLIEDKVSESGDDWYTAECLDEAVGIVKGGGIE